jgi:hypothetical protein
MDAKSKIKERIEARRAPEAAQGEPAADLSALAVTL